MWKKSVDKGEDDEENGEDENEVNDCEDHDGVEGNDRGKVGIERREVNFLVMGARGVDAGRREESSLHVR